MRIIKMVLVILAIGLPTILAFNNCSSSFHAEPSETTLSSSNCAAADPQFASPMSIDQTMALINHLPKPLTLDCFLESLAKPLNVYAVNSTFSAQPSDSADSPRIFIIRSANFVLSVTPAGVGKNLLEMGQYVSAFNSVKAEVEFPVLMDLPVETPYDTVKNVGGGTSCAFCHLGEYRESVGFAGEAYASPITRPDPFKRVTVSTLLSLANACDSTTDAFRCSMLRSVFVPGKVQDVSFP